MNILIGIIIAIIFFILGFIIGIIATLVVLFGKNSRIRITRGDDWENHNLGDFD
jgi:hypothetical protein